MTIDVATATGIATQAEIDSTISGISYQLSKIDDGQLTLGGSVTVGSLIDTSQGTGKLALNGSTTITNTDNGGAGSGAGLSVVGSATISGTGSLDLQSAAGSFNYDSTSTSSAYDGAISGPGGVVIGDTTGLLELGSSLNSYSGGTDIEGNQVGNTTLHATIKLEKDSATGAPATLGSRGLAMGPLGELDLNGCSLTLTSLNDDSFVNASNAGFASITDTSTGTGTTELPVTTLTLDIPSGAPDSVYSGSIAYTGGDNLEIRVIKTGGGTFVPNYNVSTSGGFEIDDGTVKLGTSFYFSAAIALTMNGGTLDLNGTARAEAMGPYGGQPVLDLSQLDGLGGTITDYSQTAATFPYGSGTTTYSSLLQVAPSGSGHPSVFGGRIKNGTNQLVALDLINGSGTLILTADMSGISAQYAGYKGGTVVESGCLQIGDGQTPGVSRFFLTVAA